MSEGECLEEWSDEGLHDDMFGLEHERRSVRNALFYNEKDEQMKNRYKEAEEAKIGSEIKCACCSKKIIKTTYHKRFCSNGKTKRGGNCKDKYWNTVDVGRRLRAQSMR